VEIPEVHQGWGSVLTLRPYQTEGVERILDRRNLLLAMVMGSGKTVTSVAAIRILRRQLQVRNGAVFALKSTKFQWVREIAKADPRATVQVVDGTKAQRVKALRAAHRYNYTILHYECLVNDWAEIKEYLPLDYLIMDEISALKGFSAKRTKRAKILGQHCDVRIGLSGQPLENKPEELFSIMEFIDPDVLGSFVKWDRTFIVRDTWGRPQRYRNLHLIQKRLGPAMYRKSREDIKEWLPEKIEIEMPVVLDPATMRLHDLVKTDLSDAIDKALASGGRGGFDLDQHYGHAIAADDRTMMGQVMSRLLAMRMLSSHPRLLLSSADNFDSPVSRKGSEYASELKAEHLLDNLPQENAKFDALIETVTEILDEDPAHKVVIFSYFKPMIAMMGARFVKLKQPFTTLTGDVTSADERFRRIEKFNTDPRCRIFLSSDAGAYGVDLNQGSHCIQYDLPWSAGALAQRVARIDRTSSGFDQIRIIFMYGHNTIEERMYRMLVQKAKVARAFIDGEFDTRSGTLKLDLESLREFLDAA
jgi:SNF2 family DNA or RNA helicase